MSSTSTVLEVRSSSVTSHPMFTESVQLVHSTVPNFTSTETRPHPPLFDLIDPEVVEIWISKRDKEEK